MNSNKNSNRRDFIKKGTLLTASLPFLYSSSFSQMKETGDGELVCQDIADHFQQVGKWVNWQQTTDTFKSGNPQKPVKKVVVAWKASMEAIEKAISYQADMFISHESICVNAKNDSPEPEEVFALPSEQTKFDLLRKSGLTVYRCHNFWDRFPGEGIRDSWLRGLNLDGKIIADSYPFYVSEIAPVTVRKLAKHILKQIKPLKQDKLLVSGNLDKTVCKVGTGTGVNVEPHKLWELGADVGIMTDDYYRHVREGVHANELDFPTIFVNHGVAEEWGIKNLASYIQRQFPGLEVIYLKQYCPYKFIG